MKARINQKNRGTRIDQLVKEYGFDCPNDYYEYIIESYINGHREQVIDLFNQMKAGQQKSFLLNCYNWRVRDLIISNL